jgi:hypothetical protein
MSLVDSLAIPSNLHHEHFQELDRAVTEHRPGCSRATTILHDEAVGSNDATLLRLLPCEAEERAHLDVVFERAEVQLSREQIQLHDEGPGQSPRP